MCQEWQWKYRILLGERVQSLIYFWQFFGGSPKYRHFEEEMGKKRIKEKDFWFRKSRKVMAIDM